MRCPRPTRATRTPSSPWTGPRVTNSAGTPPRSCPTWPNSPARTPEPIRRATIRVSTRKEPEPPGAIVMDAVSRPPVPVNEPVRQYQPGSHERAALESKLKELAGQQAELTMTIAGRQQMGGGPRIPVVQPHNRTHVLGHLAN